MLFISANSSLFLYVFSKIQVINLDYGKVSFLEQLGLWLHYFSPGSWCACCPQLWWVKSDTAFIFLTGGRFFFQYGKSLSHRSLFPSSLWFFCPGMQQSMLMSGLPALLSLHLGPKRWNPNQILNFQKLWNTLHKLQRTTLTKSLLLVYFLPFFSPFLSQLYFPQCEIQTDLHPGCTLSGTDEMVFGCW